VQPTHHPNRVASHSPSERFPATSSRTALGGQRRISHLALGDFIPDDRGRSCSDAIFRDQSTRPAAASHIDVASAYNSVSYGAHWSLDTVGGQSGENVLVDPLYPHGSNLYRVQSSQYYIHCEHVFNHAKKRTQTFLCTVAYLNAFAYYAVQIKPIICLPAYTLLLCYRPTVQMWY